MGYTLVILAKAGGFLWLVVSLVFTANFRLPQTTSETLYLPYKTKHIKSKFK